METLLGVPQADVVARQQAQFISDMVAGSSMGTAGKTAVITALTKGPWPHDALHGMIFRLGNNRCGALAGYPLREPQCGRRHGS